MNLRLKLFLMIGMFASLTVVHAASFDCAKASSPTEKMICQNPKISKLDDRLSEVYKEVRKADASVVEEQKSWLKDARACKDEKCLENAYGIRVEELENRLAKLEQSKNQGTSQASSNKGLDALFTSGGFWSSDDGINKSNLSCNGLLRPNSTAVLTKYEPTLMTILLRLPQGIKEIRVPINIENVKVSGNLVTFDKYEKSSNGALLGGTFQLDVSQKTLRKLRSHTCQNCVESQMMVHKRDLNGSPNVDYWCVGNY